MRQSITLVLVLAMLCGIASVGFQCSSAEFTSAKVYMQRSDWANAEKNLNLELKKNPQNEEAWYLLGRVRFETKRYAEMSEAFLKALTINDDHKPDIKIVQSAAWINLFNSGVEKFNKGRDSSVYYEKAAEDFQTATTICPDSALAYRNLAIAYINLNRPDDAIKYLEEAVNRVKDVFSAVQLANIYYEKAAKVYAPFESPSNILEVKIGDSKNDIRSTWLEPTSTNTTNKPRQKVVVDQYTYKNPPVTMTFENNRLVQWEENGAKYVAGSKSYYADSTAFKNALPLFEEAIAVINKGLKLDPNNESLFKQYSSALIATGKTTEAREAYRTRLEKDPNNKTYLYYYGYFLLKEEKYSDAIQQFQKALEIDSAYENAIYNLAVCYTSLGRQLKGQAGEDQAKIKLSKETIALAIPYLQKYLTFKPNEPDMYEYLGNVYTFVGKLAEAKEAFKKADELRTKK